MPSKIDFSTDSSVLILSFPESHSADTQYLLCENEVEMWGKQSHGEKKKNHTPGEYFLCVWQRVGEE